MTGTGYQFFHHLDAPKRVFTLTLDELVIALVGLTLLVISNQKLGASLLSMGLFTMLRYVKKSQHPKVLVVLAYWYLPIIHYFLPTLPLSYHRLYLA